MEAAELSREERDALIFQLKAEGALSQEEIGKRVGLSGTRVGRILRGVGTPIVPEGMPSTHAPVRRTRVEHRCATPGCGAVLKNERWIYSSHTGDRYCYVGEGCWKWTEKKRAQMRAANVAPKPEPIEEVEA